MPGRLHSRSCDAAPDEQDQARPYRDARLPRRSDPRLRGRGLDLPQRSLHLERPGCRAAAHEVDPAAPQANRQGQRAQRAGAGRLHRHVPQARRQSRADRRMLRPQYIGDGQEPDRSKYTTPDRWAELVFDRGLAALRLAGLDRHQPDPHAAISRRPRRKGRGSYLAAAARRDRALHRPVEQPRRHGADAVPRHRQRGLLRRRTWAARASGSS
jgi:hypothetical protein